MSEKKVVSRTTAIALGVVCIILAGGLVGALVNYTSIISGKDSTISAQKSQISTQNSTIVTQNAQISSLQSQKNQLQSWLNGNLSQVNDLTDIVNLKKSIVWVNQSVNQPAGSYTSWIFTANYAGFIKVKVQSSSTNKIYIAVTWEYPPLIVGGFGSAIYHEQDNLTQGDLATGSATGVYPILPTSNIPYANIITYIEIRVGNMNLVNSATENVTIKYYY